MIAALGEIPTQSIADFCRRNRIRRLSLFGSVLRDDFGANSDIDVLADFAPGATPGFRFIDLEDELSVIFGGRRVDLVTEEFLNHRIRPSVLATARVLYEE